MEHILGLFIFIYPIPYNRFDQRTSAIGYVIGSSADWLWCSNLILLFSLVGYRIKPTDTSWTQKARFEHTLELSGIPRPSCFLLNRWVNGMMGAFCFSNLFIYSALCNVHTVVETCCAQHIWNEILKTLPSRKEIEARALFHCKLQPPDHKLHMRHELYTFQQRRWHWQLPLSFYYVAK